MPSSIEQTCLWPSCGNPVETRPRRKFGVCPECRHVTCFACKAVHEGLSCFSFQRSREPPRSEANENTTSPVPDPIIAHDETHQTEANAVTPPVHVEGIRQREDDSVQKSPSERFPAEEEQLAICEYGSCKFQAIVDGSARQFCCPKCHNDTCLVCKAVHEFSTCLEYQTQKNVDSLAPTQQPDKAARAAVAAVAAAVVAAAAAVTVETPVECFSDELEPEEHGLLCCVCKTKKREVQVAEMRPCLHLICLSCVEECACQSHTYLVRCPAKDAEEKRCQSYVHESLLGRVLSEDEYLRHKSLMGLSLQSCATEDCCGKFSVKRDVKTATCSDCQQVNCIPCKAIHEGKTCEEYLQEIVARLDGVSVQEPDHDDRDDEKIDCATEGCEGIGHAFLGDPRAVWCSRCKQVTCLRCKKIHTVDVCPHLGDGDFDDDVIHQYLQEENDDDDDRDNDE